MYNLFFRLHCSYVYIKLRHPSLRLSLIKNISTACIQLSLPIFQVDFSDILLSLSKTKKKRKLKWSVVGFGRLFYSKAHCQVECPKGIATSRV
jgi:predicted oxidoreductase